MKANDSCPGEKTNEDLVMPSADTFNGLPLKFKVWTTLKNFKCTGDEKEKFMEFLKSLPVSPQLTFEGMFVLNAFVATYYNGGPSVVVTPAQISEAWNHHPNDAVGPITELGVKNVLALLFRNITKLVIGQTQVVFEPSTSLLTVTLHPENNSRISSYLWALRKWEVPCTH